MTKPRQPPARRGNKPDKLMRDALILALMREGGDGAAKKLNLIAGKLVEKALGGDISAIKEICDRVDGRPTQPAGEEDMPQNITRIERVTFMRRAWINGYRRNRAVSRKSLPHQREVFTPRACHPAAPPGHRAPASDRC